MNGLLGMESRYYKFGAIVRHMRVRAGLSQRDEKALLHFFTLSTNPGCSNKNC
jgi:hypothetical protein